MKKILIYDVAADSGGAQTILEKYYDALSADPENECYFAVSVLEYRETERTHMISMPWVKKSWFHRLYCDYVVMPRMVRKLKIDEVLSLQNMGIPGCSVPQTVYVHNAIPFTEHRFSFSHERFLWVYQNIIGRLTYRSLKKADTIIVQTRWMKDAVVEKCGVPKDVVLVEPVDSAIRGEGSFVPTELATFFYPSAPVAFKNHSVIVDACKLLKEQGIHGYRVLFTATEDENALASELSRQVKEADLPIFFIGKQSHEQMIIRYRESVLLFPSYLETVGLPLLEIQQFGSPIIASDCAYARETVGDYPKASYFAYHDAEALANLMKPYIVSKT